MSDDCARCAELERLLRATLAALEASSRVHRAYAIVARDANQTAFAAEREVREFLNIPQGQGRKAEPHDHTADSGHVRAIR